MISLITKESVAERAETVIRTTIYMKKLLEEGRYKELEERLKDARIYNARWRAEAIMLCNYYNTITTTKKTLTINKS